MDCMAFSATDVAYSKSTSSRAAVTVCDGFLFRRADARFGGNHVTYSLSAPQFDTPRRILCCGASGATVTPNPLTHHGLLWPIPPSFEWPLNPRKNPAIS